MGQGSTSRDEGTQRVGRNAGQAAELDHRELTPLDECIQVGAAEAERVSRLLNCQWSFNRHGSVLLSIDAASVVRAGVKFAHSPQQSTKAGVGLSTRVVGWRGENYERAAG